MTKLTNPFDTIGHRFLVFSAVLFLFITIGNMLFIPPPAAETVSFGGGMQDIMGNVFMILLSTGIACIGLAISANAMRATKGKKTKISKQAGWYLLFYFIVLILPVLFLAIGT